MLKHFLKNKKAQSTAEYALLIALVVAGVIAMQTYAQRALQARIHAVAGYMANATSGNGINGDTQYEPYYMVSNFQNNSESNETKFYDASANQEGSNVESSRTRTGLENTTYSNTSDLNQ